METGEFVIRLNSVHELFNASDYDPFDPVSLPAPGIEVMHDYLIPRPIRLAYHAVLYLPDEEAAAHSEQSVQEAVRRHARRCIREDSRQLYQLQSEGARTAVVSFFFCLLVVALIATLEPLVTPGFHTVLVAVGTICMWVAIWRPTELLLFDRLPLLRSRRTWNRMLHIPFEVRPASSAGPDVMYINQI